MLTLLQNELSILKRSWPGLSPSYAMQCYAVLCYAVPAATAGQTLSPLSGHVHIISCVGDTS